MTSVAQAFNQTQAQRNAEKRRQDRANPHVININDYRLMPNVEALRKHKDYRVYSGPMDASEAERKKWVAGALRQMPLREVVDSSADAEPFDLGTASKDELVVFALEQFNVVLSPDDPIAVLRKKVAAAAKKAEEAELV